MSAEGLSLSLTVILSGFLVTFIALVLLILVVTVFGKIMTAVTGRKGKASGAGTPAPSKAPAKPAASAPQAAVKSEDGIPGEVIAVISAAVAAMMDGSGKGFAIKSIKRAPRAGAKEGRPAWSMAGIQQNTAGF